MEHLTAEQRKEIIIRAHKLVWCTKVDYNAPKDTVLQQLEEMDEAGLALYQLGPLSKQELEEAGIIKDSQFVQM